MINLTRPYNKCINKNTLVIVILVVQYTVQNVKCINKNTLVIVILVVQYTVQNLKVVRKGEYCYLFETEPVINTKMLRLVHTLLRIVTIQSVYF